MQRYIITNFFSPSIHQILMQFLVGSSVYIARRNYKYLTATLNLDLSHQKIMNVCQKNVFAV